MNKIASNNVDEFLQRFYHCYDGVIRSINLDFSGGSYKYTASLIISVRDAQIEHSDFWVNLKIYLEDLDEYKIVRDRSGFLQVLSQGISIAFDDNKVYLNFFDDAPITITEIIKTSDFYIGAKGLYWEIV